MIYVSAKICVTAPKGADYIIPREGALPHGAPKYAARWVTPDELLHGGNAERRKKIATLGGFVPSSPAPLRFKLKKKVVRI